MFPALAAREALEHKRPAAGVIPPPRHDSAPLSISEAPEIPAVFRALSLIATAVSQLPLTVERQGAKIPDSARPSIIRRPSLDMTRTDFIEQTTLSMAATGNAYWFKRYVGKELNELEILDPRRMSVTRSESGRIEYRYDGKKYGRDLIEHLRLHTMPGDVLGFGPIQAARRSMKTARDMNDYAAAWFETGTPSGVLSSDAALTREEASTYLDMWNGVDEHGNPRAETTNPSRTKVLGRGLKYSPLALSPKDALWVDAQNFSALEIARIFGVPSTLMLAAIDGNSMTYANTEQEWLGFARFTLMGYIRAIEDAFTELTPNGQTARFNIEALLRTDTKTRYEAHRVAIESGFLTVDEVREIENLPPLGGEFSRPRTTTPTQEEPAHE